MTTPYDTGERRYPYRPAPNAGGRFVARYFSYFVVCEEACDDALEALQFLKHGEDRGELSSEGIYGPDGVRLMDDRAIHRAHADWDDAADAPILDGSAIEVVPEVRALR